MDRDKLNESLQQALAITYMITKNTDDMKRDREHITPDIMVDVCYSLERLIERAIKESRK